MLVAYPHFKCESLMMAAALCPQLKIQTPFAGLPLAEDKTELEEEGGDTLHELHLHPLH